MDYQNIFNQDFYPTPENVIVEMLKVSDVKDKIILEPSAGTGPYDPLHSSHIHDCRHE